MLFLVPRGSGRALAQVAITWNEYRAVEEFSEPFESITNLPDPIPFTDNGNGTYSLTATNFSFAFLNGMHTDPVFHVSPKGVAIISGTLPSGSPAAPYDLAFSSQSPSWNTKLLMPFWGSFGVAPQGGIQARIQSLSSGDPRGSKVLTIEWHVYEQTSISPLGPIRFQMRLYEGTNIIEYHYDALSYPGELRKDPMAASGAVIGIKNLGQKVSCDPTQSQDDRSLIILNRTVSFGVQTLQPIHCIGSSANTLCGPCASSGHNNEWAELTSAMPPFSSAPHYSTSFHYSLPSVGYRIKPVIVDVGGDTNGSGSRVCNIYKGGDTITFANSFSNHGTDVALNVPVTAQLLRYVSDTLDTILAQVRDTIEMIAPGASLRHLFSGRYILPDTPAKGIYRVRLWCNLPGDSNRLNDTVTYTLNVAGRSDAMACCINSPQLNATKPPARYPLNKPIPLSAGFFNAGANSIGTMPVLFRIADANGVILHTKDSSLIDMEPGEERGVYLGYWTPRRPGLYYAIASTHLPGDAAVRNDTLYSYPYATPGRRTEELLPLIPFIVAHPVDVAIIPIRRVDSLTMFPGAFASISATLVNNGACDQKDVIVTANIVQRGTKRVIYTKSIRISRIEAGARQSIFFPAATIKSKGGYEMTISINHRGDTNRGDNKIVTAITCTLPTRSTTPGMSGYHSRTSPSGRASP